MTYLARESERSHAVSEIAVHIRVAAPTVSKVLKRLVREGLVTSYRGAKGGYSLARPPAQITMVEIIDALEGPVALTECGSSPGLCSQESSCSVRTNWQLINGAVRGALAEITLADMAKPELQRITAVPVKGPMRRVNVL